MVEQSHSCSVRHCRARVWEVLSDFGGIAAWASIVDHASLQSRGERDAFGVGTTRRIQSGRMTLLETVTDWIDGTTLGYDITGLPPLIRSLNNTWTLEDGAPGTVITLTTHVRVAGGPVAGVLSHVAARALSRNFVSLLDDLSAHLDGSDAA